MKKLLLAATLLLSINVSANDYVVCSMHADTACNNSKSDESYYACYYLEMNACLEEFGYNQDNKSVPGCFEQCAMLPNENHRKLCYTTCTEM